MINDAKLVVMGVSGCGKSTVAAELARVLGAKLLEGDEYHSAPSIEKMRHGLPLTDADRFPWLRRLGVLLGKERGSAVLACSALKLRYRNVLRDACPGVRFVYLQIDEASAIARVAARPHHLFPATLVPSQFASLEPPVRECDAVTVSACCDLQDQVRRSLHFLLSSDIRI